MFRFTPLSPAAQPTRLTDSKPWYKGLLPSNKVAPAPLPTAASSISPSPDLPVLVVRGKAVNLAWTHRLNIKRIQVISHSDSGYITANPTEPGTPDTQFLPKYDADIAGILAFLKSKGIRSTDSVEMVRDQVFKNYLPNGGSRKQGGPTIHRYYLKGDDHIANLYLTHQDIDDFSLNPRKAYRSDDRESLSGTEAKFQVGILQYKLEDGNWAQVRVGIRVVKIDDQDPSHLDELQKQVKLQKLAAEKSSHIVSPIFDQAHIAYTSVTKKQKAYTLYELGNEGAIVDVLDDLLKTEVQKRCNPPRIIAAILDALKAMNDLGIVHRDLKFDNIVLNSQGIVKLTDFGFADWESQLSGRKGTPGLAAPEIMSGKRYDRRVDIWTLGLLVYEMMVGTTIKADSSDRLTKPEHKKVLDTCRRHKSEPWADFVLKCLRVNPNSRKSIKALLEHPWIKPAVGLPLLWQDSYA